MKKLLYVLFIIVFPVLVFSEPVERVLGLEDSITAGLHNNQKYLAVQEEISLAQQRVNESRSSSLPKIDLNMNMLQFHNITPAVLTPGFGSFYLPASFKDQFYTTRISLYQHVYAGGRFTANMRVAEANLSQAKAQADIIKNQVICDIKKAYFSCVAARTKKEMYDLLLSSSVKLNGIDIKFESEKAAYEYEKAKLHYLSVLCLELNTMVEIKGNLDPQVQEYDLNKCLAWAKQYRPELRQTQYQEAIDGLKVSLSIIERYPTVTLGANYEWSGEQIPFSDKSWNAVININLPIFDGWASWSRTKQRKIMMREGKIWQAQMEDQINLEVREAFLEYSFWKKRFVSLETPVYRVSQADKYIQTYILWVDTSQRLLESQAELDQAAGRVLSETK